MNGGEPAETEHVYLSIQCFHLECGTCPMVCGYCWVGCLCPCHVAKRAA